MARITNIDIYNAESMPVGTYDIYVLQECHSKPKSGRAERWMNAGAFRTHEQARDALDEEVTDHKLMDERGGKRTHSFYFNIGKDTTEKEILAAFKKYQAGLKPAAKPKKTEYPKFRITCRKFNVTEEQVGDSVQVFDGTPAE